jgi:hypothetical protein
MRQHGERQDGLNKSRIYEVVDEMVGWPARFCRRGCGICASGIDHVVSVGSEVTTKWWLRYRIFADVAVTVSLKVRHDCWVGQSQRTISIDLPLSRS